LIETNALPLHQTANHTFIYSFHIHTKTDRTDYNTLCCS